MSLPDGYFFGSVPAVIDVALCLPFHSLVDGVDFFQACNSFEQLTEVVLPQFLSFFYMSHFASVLHNSPALFKDFMQITIYSNTPLPVEIPDGYNIESVWGKARVNSPKAQQSRRLQATQIPPKPKKPLFPFPPIGGHIIMILTRCRNRRRKHRLRNPLPRRHRRSKRRPVTTKRARKQQQRRRFQAAKNKTLEAAARTRLK